MTEVHAEHERRAGYPDQAEDYEPSDTGYAPAVDAPEDESRIGEYGSRDRTVDDAEVVEDEEPASDAELTEEVDQPEPYAAAEPTAEEAPGATPYGMPVAGETVALPEDVTAADAVPADAVVADAVPAAESTGSPGELVEDPEALMARWQEVQVGFVDDPARAVRDADGLVQRVIEQMQRRFMAERAEMEQQWGSGQEVSTEDMRLLLQKYRTFFNRLIKV